MAEKIPPDIEADLERAAILHQRASSDYEKCREFSKLMSEILTRLEEAECCAAADKVMGILIDCNPKQGAQCEKATRIGEKMRRFQSRPG
jgi:hypothetical protein